MVEGAEVSLPAPVAGMVFSPSLALAPVPRSRLVLELVPVLLPVVLLVPPVLLFCEFIWFVERLVSVVLLMPEADGVLMVPLLVPLVVPLMVALGLAAEPWPVDDDCA